MSLRLSWLNMDLIWIRILISCAGGVIFALVSYTILVLALVYNKKETTLANAKYSKFLIEMELAL